MIFIIAKQLINCCYYTGKKIPTTGRDSTQVKYSATIAKYSQQHQEQVDEVEVKG